MPIEIREFVPGETKPNTYRLELGDDRVYLALGRKGIVVRIGAEPALGRDIGVIDFDTRELEVTKDGVKMINAPFYTKPGEKVVAKKKSSANKHFELRHISP